MLDELCIDNDPDTAHNDPAPFNESEESRDSQIESHDLGESPPVIVNVRSINSYSFYQGLSFSRFLRHQDLFVEPHPTPAHFRLSPRSQFEHLPNVMWRKDLRVL